jgi:hypothetical protein
VSLRRRRIRQRLDRIRKQEAQEINSQEFFGQIQSAIEKWVDKPIDLDAFLFDAFGPLGPVKKNAANKS